MQVFCVIFIKVWALFIYYQLYPLPTFKVSIMFHSSIHIRNIEENTETICGRFCWDVSHFSLIDNKEVYSPSFGFTKLRWDICFENIYKPNEEDTDYLFKVSLRLFKSKDDSVVKCVTSILGRDLKIYKSQLCELDCNPSYKTYFAHFIVPKNGVKSLYFGKKLVIQSEILVKKPYNKEKINGEMCHFSVKYPTDVKSYKDIPQILEKYPTNSKDCNKEVCDIAVNVPTGGKADNNKGMSEILIKIPAAKSDRETSGILVENATYFTVNNENDICEDCKTLHDMLADRVDFVISDDTEREPKRNFRISDIVTSFLDSTRNILSAAGRFLRNLPQLFMRIIGVHYNQFMTLMTTVYRDPVRVESFYLIAMLFEILTLLFAYSLISVKFLIPLLQIIISQCSSFIKRC